MIKASINTTKIDKTKIVDGKNGAKYLNIILIETPNSAYEQDFMVVQEVTKEERLAGKRGAILGNAKIMGDRGKPAHPKPTPRQDDDSDSVPF
jgi:hypothetical protein